MNMTANLKHDCKAELHNADLKVTPARLGVLAALEHADKPLDIVTLINYLQKHDIKADRVTVFRIINALKEKGLIKSIQFHERKLRYEYARRLDHHHFICENCGEIENVMDCNVDSLVKNIKKKRGLLIKNHNLEFFGLCPRCQT